MVTMSVSCSAANCFRLAEITVRGETPLQTLTSEHHKFGQVLSSMKYEYAKGT